MDATRDSQPRGDDWKTKPDDRFILRWIKLHLAAPITPHLIRLAWLRPAMITVSSALTGVGAGLIFGLGAGWLAALLAIVAQVLDGVDGQFARLTGRTSRGGAFLDSVLDRYADGALLIGMIVFAVRAAPPERQAVTLAVGALALIGANLISYMSARAATLEISLGARRTRISKGTRMTVMIAAGVASLFWRGIPFWALVYLALHANLAVARACWVATRAGNDSG